MARSPSVRVVDRRIGTGEVWASKAGSGLGASVGTHFTLLWVLAGFAVLTAIICMYAGEQRHLAERQFGDVRVHDDLEVDGDLVSHSVKFNTLDFRGLTQNTLTDAQTDTGGTFAANSVNYSAWDGDGAAAWILPSAKVGTLVYLVFTAQADGGSDITVTRAGSDTYAAQSLNFPTVNIGDGSLGPYTLPTSATPTQSLGNIVTGAANSTVLTIASTATNNMTNAGAVLGFYCAKGGEWLVSFRSSELGTGAINATFTIA
jgi:hypothetical protein